MMALTTKGRYAARIMVFLARHPGSQPVTKHDIGSSEGISPNYVEQIIIRLKAAGLVRSHRGRTGGFTLGRTADSINLAEILHAVEGPTAPAPCMTRPCNRAETCPTRPIWLRSAAVLDGLFSSTALSELAGMRASATTADDAISFEI